MPDLRVKVFVVWEPILFTDWRRPGKKVTGRVTDSRVTQIWDPNHLMARQLARDAREPQPQPECCTHDGILWDLVAVYPPGVLWTDAIPPAVLFDGPVVEHEERLETAVRNLQQPRSSYRNKRMTVPMSMVRSASSQMWPLARPECSSSLLTAPSRPRPGKTL